MADEEMGQLPGETPSEEEPKDEEPEEPEEPITPEKAYQLAQALQKGYTITRQEMAEIRENISAVQTALTELGKKRTEEYGEETGGEDEPLTVKKLLEIQKQEGTRKQQEDIRIDRLIDSQLSDLRVQGKIKTKEDEDKLLNYAVAHKITNLGDAADRMEEVEKARKEGRKDAAKGKVKEEEGLKIGTSKKTETGEQGGVSYREIATKDMGEIAHGE